MIQEKITELYLPYPDEEDRLVRIYVPSHEQGETFPVIYMTDGQNVLDKKTSSYGCWFTPEAIETERNENGQAAIIVAIHSNMHPAFRTNELTPESIGKIIIPEDEIPEELLKLFEPKGEVFDSFVTDTVMPAVEKNFPVKTGRNNTAFCGSSSGGLQAYFTAINHPDLFCASGVFSPAFMFYSAEDIISWTMSKIQKYTPYLYFYTGTGDELEKKIYKCLENVYDILMGVYPMDKLNEVILLEQKHHETAWEIVFKDFLHTFLARRDEF